MVGPAVTHPVVLLDTLPDHLGIVQGLARTGHYQLTTVGFSADDALRFSRMCRHETLSNWDWDSGCEKLDALAAPRGTVLLPVSIRATQWVIDHRDQLANKWRLVPLPAADDFHLANDKLHLAEMAARVGLQVPSWVDLADHESVDWQQLSYPALLKPRRGFGGSGIVRLEGPADLVKVLAGMTAPANYFVQRLVEGRDISCGVFCRDGEVLSSVAYRPLARQGAHGRFTSIQAIEDRDVASAVGRLMRALRWNGIANVDLVRSSRPADLRARGESALLGQHGRGPGSGCQLCRHAMSHGVGARSRPSGVP